MLIPKLSSLSLLITTLSLLAPTLANTEKAIFLAPPPSSNKAQHPSLSPWYLTTLPTLTPSNFSIRTHLASQFPSSLSPGSESWYLLDDLNPDQRYEVRVCWAATQPTSFTLTTYTIPQVLEDPDLVTSLAHYEISHTPSAEDAKERGDFETKESSKILLRIVTAADYFTDDEKLMKHPEPVHVDLILDPFLYNVLPRSLAPTVVYIAALVPVAWVVARWVSVRMVSVAREGTGEAEAKKER